MEAKKYNNSLAEISTEFAERYLAIVNYVCLPEEEFEEKKDGIHILEILRRKGECCKEDKYFDEPESESMNEYLNNPYKKKNHVVIQKGQKRIVIIFLIRVNLLRYLCSYYLT